MPTALIDDFSDETLWQALTPANLPSIEIVLATDGPSPALPAGGLSMRVELSAAAGGDRIERGFPALDLSDFAELRFWVRASQLANGSPVLPFRLSMRLGSAALAIGAPGNDWLRHTPVDSVANWSLVRVALDDLAPAVRSAASRISFEAVASPAAGPVTVWLDDLRAAAPRMTADAHAALIAALDGGLLLSGSPVPAAIEAPGAPVVAPPWIRLVNYDATLAERRGAQARRRADYTEDGHRIWPDPEPWDLFYRIDFVTANPGEQAAMLDFTLQTLGARRPLDVGGLGYSLERVPNILPDDANAASPLLRYRLGTWLEHGQSIEVQPVGEVTIATGSLS